MLQGLYKNNGAVLYVDNIFPLSLLCYTIYIGFCHGQILIETATDSWCVTEQGPSGAEP